MANETVEPRVFPVLIDTGCSVACTGFKEDFDGALVPGEFGNIKTANGTASIQGLFEGPTKAHHYYLAHSQLYVDSTHL